MPTQFDVAFHDVRFSYQGAAEPLHAMALDGVSFTAPQGKLIALVGPSGGGKTTVGQLISRFWDVGGVSPEPGFESAAGCGGKITIGGIDIRDIHPERLMDTVSFVFQDTTLFADTVRGNITMNRKFTDEQVQAAAKAAQCHGFIMRLPKGYDTPIGGGGAGLSGGEVQRIAIARAMLKDSPIIVLDEALAYSDAENENLIQKAIDRLIKDKTVIIIAHRLPSIQNADQILLLDKGQIRERGTHKELMAADTLYRELWQVQNEADDWSIEKRPAANETQEVAI